VDNNFSGIYAISNIVNGHRYIGGAVNISRRWFEHRNCLRKGINHCAPLQNAWNEYGEDNFVFRVLLCCERDNVLNYEQEYLDVLQPEYNIAKDVLAPMAGRKHKEVTKKKISESHIGILASEETKRKLSISHRGHIVTIEQREKISKSLLGKKVSGETRHRLSIASHGKHNAIPVFQYSKDGSLISSFSGAYEASQKTHVYQGNIRRCCIGNSLTAGGFVWRYIEEVPPC
jgi:group I intron endonuclease